MVGFLYLMVLGEGIHSWRIQKAFVLDLSGI